MAIADNTPPGFQDPAFLEDLLAPLPDDEHLIDEEPYTAYLDTEDNNFEQE